MPDKLVLVDENDRKIGEGEKMATHLRGDLHRAFSVLILNNEGDMLLQKRAEHKYHSGGLWSNACCGHPRPGESVPAAARRRLYEEMGIACKMKEVFTFRYTAKLERGLSENEYDHVLCGVCDEVEPNPDPDEVAEWKWMQIAQLQQDMEDHPELYTYWFKVLLPRWLAERSEGAGDDIA